jgi:hypothetical protein
MATNGVKSGRGHRVQNLYRGETASEAAATTEFHDPDRLSMTSFPSETAKSFVCLEGSHP